MKATIRKVLPNGLPSDSDIKQMTQAQKEQLYEDQKLIIKLFRDNAQIAITCLQEKLAMYASRRPAIPETRSVEQIPLKITPPPSQPQREAPRPRHRILQNQDKPPERRQMKIKKVDGTSRLFRSTEEFPRIAEKREARRQRYANLNQRPPFKVGPR